MKVLELFAGSRSIGKAFEKRGHQVVSIDWDKTFKDIDLYCDISKLNAYIIEQLFGKFDVIWASPDCTTYSIAGVSHHRYKGTLNPKSEYAKFCDNLNIHLIHTIYALSPQLYFIENPVGCYRKMNFIKGIPRYTVTYCQYGDKRMKPTDIFTNCNNPEFKPPCHNGDKCHESAPRGTHSTGTQGLCKKDRSKIPDELCDYIVKLCEREVKENEDHDKSANEG